MQSLLRSCANDPTVVRISRCSICDHRSYRPCALQLWCATSVAQPIQTVQAMFLDAFNLDSALAIKPALSNFQTNEMISEFIQQHAIYAY